MTISESGNQGSSIGEVSLGLPAADSRLNGLPWFGKYLIYSEKNTPEPKGKFRGKCLNIGVKTPALREEIAGMDSLHHPRKYISICLTSIQAESVPASTFPYHAAAPHYRKVCMAPQSGRSRAARATHSGIYCLIFHLRVWPPDGEAWHLQHENRGAALLWHRKKIRG